MKVDPNGDVTAYRTAEDGAIELGNGDVIHLDDGEVFDSDPDIWLDDDSEPMEDVFQFDNEFVTTEAIRELGAAAVRDAHDALKQLVAEGLVWAAG
jgi:hypothetical protein